MPYQLLFGQQSVEMALQAPSLPPSLSLASPPPSTSPAPLHTSVSASTVIKLKVCILSFLLLSSFLSSPSSFSSLFFPVFSHHSPLLPLLFFPHSSLTKKRCCSHKELINIRLTGFSMSTESGPAGKQKKSCKKRFKRRHWLCEPKQVGRVSQSPRAWTFPFLSPATPFRCM